MTMDRYFLGLLSAWNKQSRCGRVLGAAIALLAGTILARLIPGVRTMHGLGSLAVIVLLALWYLSIEAWLTASPALLSKAIGWLPAIGLILYGIPFIILLCHVNPMADDFGLWPMVQAKGYFGFMHDFYMAWYGRYTSSAALYWVHHLKPAWVFFPLASWVVGALTLLCAYACVRSLSAAIQPGERSFGPVLAAGVLAAIFSIMLPSIQETVLWAFSGVHYLLGSGLAVVLCG